ncbi:Protein of unknown function [Pyronema omphalodes CBS 100304]|uniref:Uncharacterized protein n=1 Tax=Pyronema omphalodes (strain CBS 100304) TaxID=1076935 RepID=U4LIQ9_PYROM|nr:Protein of unknown function [Pyronema omphalodes CBS 100304]
MKIHIPHPTSAHHHGLLCRIMPVACLYRVPS